MPKISLVIPVFNTEQYLERCLQSVGAQRFDDFDVVLVNDGSTDASATILRAWAAKDERFRVVDQQNRGPGPGGGRNGGLDSATGDWIMFVDSDDVLTPGALESAASLMGATTSFVTLHAERLVGAVRSPSPIHDTSHPALEAATTAERSPWLMYDTTPWNKVFRRSFFDDTVGRWDEQSLYEDIVPMTRAHLVAESIAVSDQVGYLWRKRGEGSITNPSLAIHGDLAQLDRLRSADELVRADGTDEMKRWLHWKALTSDLLWMFKKLGRLPQDQAYELHHALSRFVQTIDSDMIQLVHEPLRTAYELAAQGSPRATQRAARTRGMFYRSDLRTPDQAGRSGAQASLVRASARGDSITLTVRTTGLDVSRPRLTLSGTAPWCQAVDDSLLSIEPSSNRGQFAQYVVSAASLRAGRTLYPSIEDPASGERAQLYRSAVHRLAANAPVTRPHQSPIDVFYESESVRLRLAVNQAMIHEISSASPQVVLVGSGWNALGIEASTAVAVLSRVDQDELIDATVSVEPGDRFAIEIDDTERLHHARWIVSIASGDNPAIATPLTMSAPTHTATAADSPLTLQRDGRGYVTVGPVIKPAARAIEGLTTLAQRVGLGRISRTDRT